METPAPICARGLSPSPSMRGSGPVRRGPRRPHRLAAVGRAAVGAVTRALTLTHVLTKRYR